MVATYNFGSVYMYIQSVSDFALHLELYIKYKRGRLRSYYSRTEYIG